MARTRRSNVLESRTNRAKLKIGARKWVAVGEGAALGYRRTAEGFGTWQARIWTRKGYRFSALGEADDFRDANGETVLDYFQAYEKARAWALDAENLASVRGRKTTVGEAAERYLAWYRDHRKAYRETELTVNAHILPAFKDRRLADLRKPEISEWHEKLAALAPRRRTGKKAKRPKVGERPKTDDAKRARRATANRILTVLKAILNRAYEDELVADNGAWKRVKPFKNANEPKVRFLATAECERLSNACPADFRALAKAALFTGARYSELASLCVADVNLDAASVYIRPSKSGRGRHVPLSPAGLAFFRSVVAGKLGDALAFTKADGTPWGKNHHVRALKGACATAKITPEIGFHELRHTYASLLAQRGADLLTISKLLGHADTRITARHYAHLCDRTLATAVRNFLPDFGHVEPDNVVAIR